MSLFVALLVAVGVLLWPDPFARCRLSVLPQVFAVSLLAPRSGSGSVSGWMRWGRWWRAGRAPAVKPQDLLGLLGAVAAALEAGMAPAMALRMAADSRSDSGRSDPLTSLARGMASAAADGTPLGPLWRAAADSAGSAELLLLAHAWSLTEEMGAPLAQAIRTTAGLLEARVAHERRLASAVAGARATVNLLTVLPVAGPLLALVLGIGPAELFGESRLTQGSLAIGLCLASVGRWWVQRMVRAVARGPVIA